MIRAQERYGLHITPWDIRCVITQVTDGHALKLRKISQQLAVYLVTVQGHDCRIVYNRYRKFIITFLPLDDEKYLAEKICTP